MGGGEPVMEHPEPVQSVSLMPFMRLLAEIIIEDAKAEESSACEPELALDQPASE